MEIPCPLLFRKASSVLGALTTNMDALEKLVQHRDHCLEMVEKAPTEAIRVKRLRDAYLYGRDVHLIEQALQHIAESKKLISKAATLLGL